MKIIRGVLFGLLFLAQIFQCNASSPLVINVYHNRSLDDDVIIAISGLEQDPLMSAVEVKRRLETTGLFSLVVVKKQNNRIDIIVDEKTTWMVIPYLYSESSSTVYGVAGGKLSTNGQHNKVIGRYQQGKDSKESALLYRDEYFRSSLWSVGISYDFEDSFHKIFYSRSEFDKRSHSYKGVCPKVGYHFDPHLYLEANSCWERHRFENSDKNFSKGDQISHKVTGTWSNFYQREGLARGRSFELYLETSNWMSDYHFTKWGVSSDISLYLDKEFNWIIRPKIEYGFALPFYRQFESGPLLIRGFNEQQFRDHYYLSVQNDLFVNSFHLWKMIVRPLLFFDTAYYQDGVRIGMGPGFHLYFKNIAMPAVQFFTGYGINPQGLTVSLSLGPQF